MSEAMAFMPSYPRLADDMAQLVANVTSSRRQLRDDVCALIQKAIADGLWLTAITIVVKDGGLSEAEIARGLEMTRSTVNRWLAGQTEPPAANMSRLGEKLIKLVRDR